MYRKLYVLDWGVNCRADGLLEVFKSPIAWLIACACLLRAQQGLAILQVPALKKV